MKALIRHWFCYFGPMKVCISDQEGCITSDSVGANFERLSIVRRVKGSDRAGKHTGTGGVERHIQLTKLTMRELKCELDKLNI